MAAKVIKKMLENSKNITFADTVVTVKSAMKQNTADDIERLADEIINA